jgi:hypothetical protein
MRCAACFQGADACAWLRWRAGLQDLRVAAGAALALCLFEVSRRTLAAARALRARHAPPQPASPQPLASPRASPLQQQQEEQALSPPDSLGRVASLGTWLQRSAQPPAPASPTSFSFGSPPPAAATAAASPATVEARDVRATHSPCALPAACRTLLWLNHSCRSN